MIQLDLPMEVQCSVCMLVVLACYSSKLVLPGPRRASGCTSIGQQHSLAAIAVNGALCPATTPGGVDVCTVVYLVVSVASGCGCTVVCCRC